MQDQVWWVTGASSGIGAALARALAARGARLILSGRNVAALEAVAKDCGAGTMILPFEATDYAALPSLAEEAWDWCGRIDGLVNNAGVHLKKPIWDVKPEELDHVLNINVKAMFTTSGRYIALQKDSGGAIVNISSMGGIMALLSAAAYVTTKTAVIGLTRSIAVDAAPFGFRCNAVCPGFIDTAMTRKVLAGDPARLQKIEGRIPSHKFGTTEDVARAIYYLISDESRYINGVALPVDDGYSIGF